MIFLNSIMIRTHLSHGEFQLYKKKNILEFIDFTTKMGLFGPDRVYSEIKSRKMQDFLRINPIILKPRIEPYLQLFRFGSLKSLEIFGSPVHSDCIDIDQNRCMKIEKLKRYLFRK